jgi:dihydroorotate dehydrogenase
MNLYSLIKPWLFAMDAERAHNLTLKSLKIAQQMGLSSFVTPTPVQDSYYFCGLHLKNRVGLAAGLDKDGKYIDALAALGFGFLEIGTVTPKPQPGNPFPRMFRLPQARAIINRMGFNNDGIDACIQRVKQSSYWQNGGVLGINIGKNATTPMDMATADYLIGLQKAYPVASYITVNISSPNTQNLRQLQGGNELDQLLSALAQEKLRLRDLHKKQVPLFLKIAPDLEADQIRVIAELLLKYQIDAVIATNTTITRDTVAHLPFGQETGGLSGEPVRRLSTSVVSQLHQHLRGTVPIIGVGGILSGQDAREKISAGASLVQVYSGLIYQGPNLIQECAAALAVK